MTWCDLHYEVDNCLGVGTQPTHPTLPSTVWVAVAVYTKTVVVRTQQAPATTPISGRMSIFERAATTTRESFRAEVLCVGTEAECRWIVENHKTQGTEAEYSVTEHKLGIESFASYGMKVIGSVMCIDCQQVEVVGGPVKCQKCIEKQWAEQREAFVASGGRFEEG